MSDYDTEENVIEVDFVRKDVKAYCFSEKCSNQGRKSRRDCYKPVLKRVVKTTTFCLDCHSALVWSPENELEDMVG